MYIKNYKYHHHHNTMTEKSNETMSYISHLAANVFYKCLKAKGHDYHAPGYIQANMIMPVHSAILSNLRPTLGKT